mmetsp:Transcript_44266/g.70088  ORF Transcript_44266/g.70088 Transcript_44266/m.70088 type:complete len:542 (-) Transcript_44266:96-1721(-)
MASWLCVVFFSLATPASATCSTISTTLPPTVPVTPASCFESLLDNQFTPTQANVKRIICPYLSTMINTGTLPMKKFYTRNELMEATKAAGSNPQAGQAPFDPTGHVAANFQFNAPGLIDIFNMEGNPNEHDLSSGINDCETTYPCFDEAGRGKCTHTPSIVGRLTPMPIPVPNGVPTSPTATAEPEGGGRVPAYINFCPDILDHLPKCLSQVITPACGCTIPNAAKATEFWNTLDTNKDGLATISDLEAIRTTFAMPGFPPMSIDKNPVGSVALAGSFDLLNQIFSTAQSSPVTGASEVGLNQAQFMALNIQRVFPSTYTFPGGCFVDPNQAVNQNDYTSPAAMTAAGWTMTPFTGTAKPVCIDKTNGISQYTGDVWFGSSAKVTVKGSGTGYVDFGNCADAGIVTLSVGGQVIANAYQNFPSKVMTFPYTNGQVVEISATSGTSPAVARLNFVAFNGTLVDSAGAPCPAPASPCAPVAKFDASEAQGSIQQSFQLPLAVMLVLSVVGSAVVWSSRRISARTAPRTEGFTGLAETGMLVEE